MPRITATATASPPHLLDRETLKTWIHRLYRGPKASALERLTARTGILRRHLALPVEEVVRPRPFGERNAEFAACALPLAETAARRALDRAHLDPARVDLIVTTSCTGLLIPSLEALLAPRLGLRPDVARLPITQLGCAAGAAALARAGDHLVAHPGRVALVLAVELPSLTFQRTDASMTNLVAGSLFGDGAAATLLGAPPIAPSPRLIESRSHLWPDTAHLMGFTVAEGGLHVLLDRDVPAFLSGRVRPLVEALCRDHQLAVEDLTFAALHPGGRRILQNLEHDLGLPAAAFAPAHEILRNHGNMSSATVLFVLDELLTRHPPPPAGSYGLLAAFGPGFAAELSLLRWES